MRVQRRTQGFRETIHIVNVLCTLCRMTTITITFGLTFPTTLRGSLSNQFAPNTHENLAEIVLPNPVALAPEGIMP